MLSDESRRQVYDIYGKEGLQSGLEVGASLSGPAELKREWERFKKRQERHIFLHSRSQPLESSVSRQRARMSIPPLHCFIARKHI